MIGIWWIDLLSFISVMTPVVFGLLSVLIYHRYDVYKARRIKWRRITDNIDLLS